MHEAMLLWGKKKEEIKSKKISKIKIKTSFHTSSIKVSFSPMFNTAIESLGKIWSLLNIGLLERGSHSK